MRLHGETKRKKIIYYIGGVQRIRKGRSEEQREDITEEARIRVRSNRNRG